MDPEFTHESIYSVSEEALHGDPDSVQAGVDAVMDTMSDLCSSGKYGEVDTFIKEIEVKKVHGDILAAFLAILESESVNLKEFADFKIRADAWIYELDAGVRISREKYGR